jgi:hypothetical protein
MKTRSLVVALIGLTLCGEARAQEAAKQAAVTGAAPPLPSSSSQIVVPRLIKFSGTLLDPQPLPKRFRSLQRFSDHSKDFAANFNDSRRISMGETMESV